MNKIEETRQRFEENVGEDAAEELSNRELKNIGQRIERLNLDDLEAKEGFVKVLEETKDYEDPKTTKRNMAGILGVSPRQINYVVSNLTEGEDYVELGGENEEKEYAHPDSDYGRIFEEKGNNVIGEVVREAYQESKHILGGYREPTLEEVAEVGGIDSQENGVRRALHRIKFQEDWTEPSEKIIEDWKEELPELIGYATIILKLEDLEPKEVPGEEIYSSEKYAEKNKELIEEIEIKERKVGYDLRLPMKLVRFTDQRIINIQPTGDELEDRKYIVR